MQTIGTKYQIFENDEMKIRRLIVKRDNSNYLLKEYNNYEYGKIKYMATEDEILNKYIKITPDGFLNIMITKEPSLNENEEINDVYFCLNRSCDLSNGDNIPALLLRQNTFDQFRSLIATDGNIYVGDCATIVNRSKDDIKDLMQFKAIKSQFSIAVYIDDSLEDIMNLIPKSFIKDINKTLESIKEYFTISPAITGACESIDELFDRFDFIGNFKSVFNITQIDFPIDLGKESYNKDGDIVLNKKQVERLQDILRRYISNIKVIKYDKDIDISKIVTSQHVVVNDSDNKIYLIAYTVDGYYADSEGAKQVLESMGK